ncbi:MAG TPA: hypothetical protein PLL55_01585, partial [Candidatus Aminicenantes bacterium]|nr:hypothetical protein [Candidatus Aminicenantes bacterium]
MVGPTGTRGSTGAGPRSPGIIWTRIFRFPGIQAIPPIARQAAHLHVFQRTPNYSLPAVNHPLDSQVVARVKAEYAA